MHTYINEIYAYMNIYTYLKLTFIHIYVYASHMRIQI